MTLIFTVVGLYFAYFFYTKNQVELLKLRDINDSLKKEKELLENGKKIFENKYLSAENKIRELERENKKIKDESLKAKQESVGFEKRIADSAVYCEDKIKSSESKMKEGCTDKIDNALLKREQQLKEEFTEKNKNLISVKKCKQDIAATIEKTKDDLRKDYLLAIKDYQLDNRPEMAVKEILEAIFISDDKKRKQKIEQPPIFIPPISSENRFNSVNSPPHLFVDIKTTKLTKESCLKRAQNKMSRENGFSEIFPQKDGVWGLKNGYKGYIFCGKQIAVFNTVGDDGDIARNYAKELKKNF